MLQQGLEGFLLGGDEDSECESVPAGGEREC